MKDEVFFSVIVPVYNVEKYLRRCIDSIINQSFSNFELILINDGSSDTSPAICDEYERLDERISVIHCNNNGVSIARNTGIQAAKGQWIVFSDSDDWIEKETLNNAYKAICENKCDIIQFGFRFVYPNRIIEKIPQINKNDNLSKLHFCTMVIKKSFMEKNEIFFPEHISFAEDWFFKFKVYSSKPEIFYSSFISYNYYVNSDSVMNNINCKNIMDEIKVIKMAEKINSPYKNNLIFQKKVSKDKILFNLHNVKLWKTTFKEVNISHLFWLGPKHFIKSCLIIIKFGLFCNKEKNDE